MRQRILLSVRSLRAPAFLACSLLLPACDGSGPGTDDVASLAIVSAPGAAIAGSNLPAPVVVELRSATGEAVAVEGILVTASVSLGQVAGTTTVRTDADGRAEFTGLAIQSEGLETMLRFRCCGLSPVSHPISLLQGDNLLTRASPPTIEGRAGSVVTPGPAVRLYDADLAPFAGQTVTFTLVHDETVPLGSMLTDIDGMAELPSVELPPLPGEGRIFASVGGTTQAVWFEILTTTSGTAALIDAEPLAAAPTGSSFVLPTVRVTDGGPVAGATVRYRVVSGNATLASEAVLTDANGESAPISLSVARGKSEVEIVAVGYSRSPLHVDVIGATGPVTVSGGIGDGYYNSLILPPVFVWEAEWLAWAMAGAYDAEGLLAGFPLELIEIGEAGRFSTYGGFQLVSGSAIGTEGGFYWEIPAAAGTYEVHVTGPLVETPLVFKATRP